jgi:hypothetical protein
MNLTGSTWEQLMSFILTTGAFSSVFWFAYNWTQDTFYYASDEREHPPEMNTEFQGAAFIMMIVALGMGVFNFIITKMYDHCCKPISLELTKDKSCYGTFVHVFQQLRDVSLLSFGRAAGLWSTFEQAMALQDKDLRTSPLRYEYVAMACASLSFVLLIYETILAFRGTKKDERQASELCGLIDTFQTLLGKSICTAGPLWMIFEMIAEVILPLVYPGAKISSFDRHATAIATLSLSGFEGLRNYQHYTSHPGLQKLLQKLRNFCRRKRSPGGGLRILNSYKMISE